MKKSIVRLLAAIVSCWAGFTVTAANLGISYTAGQVNLVWPTGDVWLQSSGTLMPNSWVNVSAQPGLIGGSNALAIAAAQSVQFFRLVQSPYLPPPTELALEAEETDAGSTWLALYWDAVPLAVAYNLYYAADPSVNQSNYASLPGGGVLRGIANNDVAVSNLIAGLPYYFVATAVSTSGESAHSYPVSGMFGPFGDVSGTVTSMLPEGTNIYDQEIPGVTVTLNSVTQPQLTNQTVSDQNGHYGFANQPAGIYQLCWSAPGFIGGCLQEMVVVSNEPVDLDLTITNNGSGLLFGHVSMADGSMAVQNDSFFGLQDNVVVSLGLPGQAPLQTVTADGNGDYLMANVPTQSGLVLTANNGSVGVSLNVSVAGIQEVDLALPNAPPGIVSLGATANGLPVNRASPGTELLVTVLATNASGASGGLNYYWVAGGDTTNFISTDSPIVNWTLPNSDGDQLLYVVVTDQNGGYATARLDVSTDLGGLFSGEVLETNGIPIVGAVVSINGETTLSDTNGFFMLLITNDATSYVLQVTSPGYVPFVEVFDAGEEQGIQCFMMPDASCFIANSTTEIALVNSSGAQLFIPANSLVTASGGPPQQPVCVTLTTLDPCAPGSQLGLSTTVMQNGTNLYLEFLGMADVRATDASGAPLRLLANQPMTLNMAGDTNCGSPGNQPLMLWWYDETASVWRPIGSASGGTGAGGAPSYAAAPMQLGLLAAAEEGPTGAFYTFKIDKTISVPINLRILDMKTGAVVRKRQTVGLANVDANKAFNRTVTMYLPLDALQAQVISPKEAPEFYATIDDDANKTAIAQVLKAAGADSAKVITLSLSSQIPNLTESRVEAPDTFLTKTFGPGKNKTALAYYEAVDPFNEKTTFSNWLEMNGFTSNGVAQAEDAKTVFFNACDLGFGRSMHLKMTKASDGQTNLAFYVSNFPSAVDANANRDEIATVAMDYVPHPKFQKRMTAFYVFPKGKNQQRLTSADLDGKGAKFVPNLCMICHGGSKEKLDNVGTEKNPSGDVLARFLPFDLNSYTYGANNGPLSQSAQAAMFKTLNQGVLLTAPTPATLTLVQGWYGSGGGGFSFVPPGWTNTPGNANVKSAYASAFAISCRTCHVSRFDASLAFPSFADLNEKSGDVDYLVYDLPKKEAEPMPNAFRTFTLFWGSEGANTAGVVTPQKPPPDQTLLLQSVLGLKGPRPAAP